ncbi:uncharacterized protein LOC106169194 [Lingula anatina]|uniref:Uncharacterized protein LOC106169194 n=1 Tax=Lingula anatina TaxID=7574 RepID=A0A1S3J196_LINAN|nr:uncharacterized protein LOC106169194 [Lingula anatina]|eukprot:XP_013404033.1 uncharacterized protein LOC106169194 [Lingula anatina]
MATMGVCTHCALTAIIALTVISTAFGKVIEYEEVRKLVKEEKISHHEKTAEKNQRNKRNIPSWAFGANPPGVPALGPGDSGPVFVEGSPWGRGGSSAGSGSPCKNFDKGFYDLVVETDGQGTISGPNKNNAIMVSFSGGWTTPRDCARQALAKIDFDAGAGRRLRIDMCFKQPQGFNINIGDSISNNGYGGDGNHQTNDAEVHNINSNFYAYASDLLSATQLVNDPGAILSNEIFSMEVRNNYIGWANSLSISSKSSSALFALNHQYDQGPHNPGTNSIVYMGMNRVISYRQDRIGRGLCSVGFKWF